MPEPALTPHRTLGAAILAAEREAVGERRAVTLLACLGDKGLTYHTLASEQYAALVERGALTEHTPICSVLANGRIEIHLSPRTHDPD